MVDLPKKKVGLISCSGEDLPEGTVSRVATRQVLERLRPEDTTTLCLPLFLAGEERERAFARFYPTIAVDGCDKRCAARATEKYSAKPAVSLVISDLIAQGGFPQPQSRRQLDAAGEEVAQVVAEKLAQEVDRLLGKMQPTRIDVEAEAPGGEGEPDEMVVTACACGSGIPVAQISVNGHRVEVLALPAILAQFREMGKPADEATADELMEAVRLYNQVPNGEAAGWRLAVLREYTQTIAAANSASVAG
jgi:uncharacterized metal-binding protein